MQILRLYCLGALVAAYACEKPDLYQGPEAQSVQLVTRAWLSALDRGDSLAGDSLSAPSEGLQSARHLTGRGPSFVADYARPTSRVMVVAVRDDSAVVEVQANRNPRTALGVRLVRVAGRWRVLDAAPLRRD
jgi:hypothetical protein